MKVSELLDILKNLPPEMDVLHLSLDEQASQIECVTALHEHANNARTGVVLLEMDWDGPLPAPEQTPTERACETCGQPVGLNMRVCPACYDHALLDDRASVLH